MGYETGAGGSAPKHVQQFQKESHLRWDSLGEFLAFACSLEDIGMKTGNTKVQAMAEALTSNEEQIAQELITCQGVPADLGGYYMPNDDMASKLMRPSAKLNEIVDSMN